MLMSFASVDLFECSGEGVSAVHQTRGLFHIYLLPRSFHLGKYNVSFIEVLSLSGLRVNLLFSSRGEITPRIICPPSHLLAEAVPGNEGDHPCISRGPVIRNQSKGTYVRCGHGGSVI